MSLILTKSPVILGKRESLHGITQEVSERWPRTLCGCSNDTGQPVRFLIGKKKKKSRDVCRPTEVPLVIWGKYVVKTSVFC